MKLILVSALLITSFLQSFSSTVEFEVQLLTPDLVGDITIDKKTFFPWFKQIQVQYKEYLEKENGNYQLLFLYTIHKDSAPSLIISSRPKIGGKFLKELQSIADKNTDVRTLLNDYSFALITNINGGCQDEQMGFDPPFISPDEKKYREFQSMSLPEKKEELMTWSRTELVPILSHYELMVDTTYKGVIAVGKIMDNEEFKTKTSAELTTYNPDYWRGIMEMSQGNQLILFSRMCIHLQKGELDRAKRLTHLMSAFSGDKTIFGVFGRAVDGRLSEIDRLLTTEINKGIELHNQGKYVEAVDLYEGLLKDFSSSAWLNYEWFFSVSAMPKNKGLRDSLWMVSKKKIYECDQLYSIDVSATNGEEAYRMFLRQQIQSLFQNRDSIQSDMIKYADIALDLQQYDFAAQVYWLIYSHYEASDYGERDLLSYFLFCQAKLGNKQVIDNFKGDRNLTFSTIEREREQIMKSSLFYNAFIND